MLSLLRGSVKNKFLIENEVITLLYFLFTSVKPFSISKFYYAIIIPQIRIVNCNQLEFVIKFQISTAAFYLLILYLAQLMFFVFCKTRVIQLSSLRGHFVYDFSGTPMIKLS